MAESFGSDAERYDRARPRYLDTLVHRIVAASPGPDVLDVGCGTGIAARQFQEAGCRVSGVEPDARMAELARRHGLAVDESTFEAWDPDGRAFDVVVAGQAWHWVDPVAGAAKAAQVLRPGGRLAVFWYLFQPPAEVVRALADVYGRAAAGLVNPWARPAHAVHRAITAKAADGIRRTAAFGDPEEWRYDTDKTITRDELLDEVPTLGGHDRIPPADLEALLTGIGAAVDALGGSFTGRFTTVAVTATRRNTA